jgi:penicillin-binding protein 1C
MKGHLYAGMLNGLKKTIPRLRSARGRRALYLCSLLVLVLFFLLCLPDPLFEVYYSPVLRDREGRLLGAMAAHDGQWRFPPGDRINEKFAAAIIESDRKSVV